MTQTTANNGLSPSSLIVIPARLASTRLPRKLLLRETGKSLIQHTFEAARRATRPHGICVATDHVEIQKEVESFGGLAEMTSPECASGTDRVAEIAARRPDVEILVNVQGDEPEIAASAIDLVVQILENEPQAMMATLATPIRRRELLEDPSCVKVVFRPGSTSAQAGRALYFSRSVVPHAREWSDNLLLADPPHFHQHLGIYAYRRDFLLQMARLPPSRLETVEKLEQLRVLEAGHAILVGVIPTASVGIDTPHDYRAFVERTLAR